MQPGDGSCSAAVTCRCRRVTAECAPAGLLLMHWLGCASGGTGNVADCVVVLSWHAERHWPRLALGYICDEVSENCLPAVVKLPLSRSRGLSSPQAQNIFRGSLQDMRVQPRDRSPFPECETSGCCKPLLRQKVYVLRQNLSPPSARKRDWWQHACNQVAGLSHLQPPIIYHHCPWLKPSVRR